VLLPVSYACVRLERRVALNTGGAHRE
jgi:hypothetical protein